MITILEHNIAPINTVHAGITLGHNPLFNSLNLYKIEILTQDMTLRSSALSISCLVRGTF